MYDGDLKVMSPLIYAIMYNSFVISDSPLRQPLQEPFGKNIAKIAVFPKLSQFIQTPLKSIFYTYVTKDTLTLHFELSTTLAETKLGEHIELGLSLLLACLVARLGVYPCL